MVLLGRHSKILRHLPKQQCTYRRFSTCDGRSIRRRFGVLFQQWLFVKGQPQLKWNWDYSNGKVNLKVQQLQDHHVFVFPLEIGIVKDGKMTIKTIKVNQRNQNIAIETKDQPDSIVLDPNEWTLFEDMGKL